MRLAGLAPGAKLDLVQSATAASAAITVVLRTVDPVEQLTAAFAPSTSVWDVLRRFEQDLQAAGRANVSITERCAPSATGPGAGRLLYQMPAVRVANRELARFEDLHRTLEDLGCSGRELMVLRFLPTEVPYEEALMEIAGLPPHPTLDAPAPQAGEAAEAAAPHEDAVMAEPANAQTPGERLEETPPAASEQAGPSSEHGSATPQPEEQAALPAPKVTVYQPSSSQVPAAATFEVPDSAYDIGIADLKRIKQNYHNASLPQRLPSDKEIEEREALRKEALEKASTVSRRIAGAC